LEFQKSITKYPFLIYQQPLAVEIYNEIRNNKFPVTSISGELYRAREVQSSEILISDNMHNPPSGKSYAGRFNHPGQSYYYLSGSSNTAIKEVISDKKAALVWNQKFQINHQIDKILDLSYSIEVVSTTISTLYVALKIYNKFNRSSLNKDNWKPDYYLTRYIMDCSKKLGYNGIQYNSTKDSYMNNVVLFYPEKVNLEAIGKPNIQQYTKEDYDTL